MAKEVENIICEFCESNYKLSYDPGEVSGEIKFCPFCGDETSDVVDLDYVEDP